MEGIIEPKRILVLLLLSLLFSVFVAPIPASKIADESEAFAAARDEVFQPKTGPFRINKCYEYEGQVVEITMLGVVNSRVNVIMAEYEQIIRITDEFGNIVEMDNSHIKRYLPVVPSDSRRATQTAYVLALDDYGTFSYYQWHGITMIKYPGSTKQGIHYEHPDNYYQYHPQQWNVDWSSDLGNGYAMHHISQSRMYQAIQSNTIEFVISSIVAAAIEIYGILIGLALLTAKAVAAALAIIVLYYSLVSLWLQFVVQAEQDDGWAYTFWNGWILQISYGGWKDFWTIIVV